MSTGATPLPRLFVILGPTGSGKSSLGIELARRFNGEVLACDSTQVYRHFDIGTAKVPSAERQGIPHHLLDLVEPTEVFTAGEYRRRALEVLADVTARGRLPILTAGTGLYLRALLDGLADAPERSESLRARLRETEQKKGAGHLHRLLARHFGRRGSESLRRCDLRRSAWRAPKRKQRGTRSNPVIGTYCTKTARSWLARYFVRAQQS